MTAPAARRADIRAALKEMWDECERTKGKPCEHCPDTAGRYCEWGFGYLCKVSLAGTRKL